MPTRRPQFTFFIVLVSAGAQTSAGSLSRPNLGQCSPLLDTSGLISLQTDCSWAAQAAVRSKESVRIAAARQRDVGAGTVSLFTETGSPPVADHTGISPGLRLQLERLVLVGFTYAGPGATEPLLWPRGLLQQAGTVLNLTDVRLVTDDPATFSMWLHTFITDDGAMYWTDNSSFLHIHHWTDGKTTLDSVGLLLETAALQNSLQLPSPHISNCILGATNSTLVPALLTNAAVATPQPLLVYLTTNVSLGAFPKLPATGVLVNRPVIFVGLQSLVTSIDFQMVVNQLNETGSKYSNVTFVGVVLENLAPGDAITTALAPPFSIAISNNVWAVSFNRSVANVTRLAYCNVTLVVSAESEMAYVTYMFTLFTSTLPYLRKQTTFYSDVLHMSILQFQPGPGSKAVTVSRLKSWYSQWNQVVLTAEPVVAEPMEAPVPLVAVSTTRVSPLVQSVDSASKLRAAGQSPVLGNREHILLVLNNISLAAPGSANSSGNCSDPIMLQSDMSWVGTSPAAQAAGGLPQQQQQTEHAVSVAVNFGYVRCVVVVAQPVTDLGLQIRQLMFGQLPQGPNVAAAVSAGGRRVPKELWTLLLWSIDRPMAGKGLSLDGVQLQLPRSELAYLRTAAQQSGDFVVELDGDKSTALTFQDVSCVGIGCSSIHAASFQGPGIVGTNVTLGLDPAAETSIAGYIWPERSVLAAATHKPLAPWATAVIAICAVLAAALAAGGFVLWRRRRAAHRQALLDPFSKMEFGSSLTCSCKQSVDSHHHLGRKNGRCSKHGSAATSAVSCANCEVCRTMANGSCATVDSVSDLDGLGKSVAIATAGDALGGVDQGAVLMPLANLDHAVKQMQQQLADAAAQQYQQEGNVSASKGSLVPVHGTETYADRVAVGMQRWRAAVSNTTIQLMERRMDAAGHPGSGSAGSVGKRTGSSGPSGCGPTSDLRLQHAEQLQQQLDLQQLPPAAGQQSAVSVTGSTAPQLQLTELLGQGSFGNVHLGVWRGKRVAVKIMQLPASALLGPIEDCPFSSDGQQDNSACQDGALPARQRLKRKQQNSCPHMAIMETVVSSTMSHPNVVQVYTYMLNPLTVDASSCGGSSRGGSTAMGSGPKGPENIAGWELKIIMEYCDEGSLRDALDCNLLCQSGSYLAPSAVLRIAHDIAAAMMHLHSEGIVHGDLKAGNVMLISSGNNGADGTRVYSLAEGRRFTAKVADFGLAMPLGPKDTHATLMARGTPTHMSPELFISGHVGKASDVYAYGILLFEIITGQRAYAGVPLPLLPHEVARQGLRPTWPISLPPGCKDLKKLAEACWAAKPQDRPTFGGILAVLDHWAAGGVGWPTAAEQLPSRSISPDTFSARPAAQQQLAAYDQQGQLTDPGDAAQRLNTPSLHTSKRSPGSNYLSGMPAASSDAPSFEEQQQQLSPQQLLQQQQGLQTAEQGAVDPSSDAGGIAARLSGGQSDRQRNRQLDWSEVDCHVDQ